MKRNVLILSLILSLFTFSAQAAQRTIARIDSFITTGAAESGGTILFGDSVGNFYAVGASSWTYHDSDASAIGIPAVQGDKVVFAQADGTLTCLNIGDGAMVWRYSPAFSESVNDGLNDGAAVGGGLVYASFTTGEVRAFDLKNGRVAWTYKAEQGLRTAPAYSGGLVLVGEYNGIFSMLDAKTGERVNGGGAGGAINTPSVNAGNVYYSAWDGSVHAVQIKDVIPLWDANVGEPITTAPVIAGGIIVVQTANGKVIALSEKDGSILWKYDSQGGDSGTKPSVSRGRVFAGTGDNRVIVLDAKTGRLVREAGDTHALNTSGSTKFYYISEGSALCVEE